MQVFISSSERSRTLARTLADALRERGIAPWVDTDELLPGDDWRRRTEEALRQSKYVVTLFDSSGVVSPFERRTLTEVVNAMWQDDSKRLIPILLRDASLPDFMHTTVEPDGVQAIRVRDPRVEWRDAVDRVASIICEDNSLVDVDLGEVIRPAKGSRTAQAKRLSYIEGVAERLKSSA